MSMSLITFCLTPPLVNNPIGQLLFWFDKLCGYLLVMSVWADPWQTLLHIWTLLYKTVYSVLSIAAYSVHSPRSERDIFLNGREMENGPGNGNPWRIWEGKWDRILDGKWTDLWKQWNNNNIFCQQKTGKTREYRHNTIQEALFSTRNVKNTWKTGTWKMQYDMIWMHSIQWKSKISENAKKTHGLEMRTMSSWMSQNDHLRANPTYQCTFSQHYPEYGVLNRTQYMAYSIYCTQQCTL